MKMIGHQDVRNQFAWPFVIDGAKFVNEDITASSVSKDSHSIEKVTGDKMERARKICV